MSPPKKNVAKERVGGARGFREFVVEVVRRHNVSDEMYPRRQNYHGGLPKYTHTL